MQYILFILADNGKAAPDEMQRMGIVQNAAERRFLERRLREVGHETPPRSIR
ncbi:MAG TPA: hypothetical protein VK714_08180 [Myxococcota bacterium]|nr:hypothetical protein [Myxococcota bacterium]